MADDPAAQLSALRERVSWIADEFDRAIAEAERPKGGQQVMPSGGDFWPVGPGVVGRFRWWSREIRRWLAEPPQGGGAQERIALLEAAIRQHRDEKGHDRCWLDDMKLYAVLPEGAATADLTLPPRDEFLRGCERYYELRRANGPDVADAEARRLAKEGKLGT